MYTVVREKTLGWQFVTFRLLVDCLQLWLLLVSPNYGFSGWIDNDKTVWKVGTTAQ